MTDVPIRDAATVLLTRQIDGEAHLLMGQRGKSAAFMPNKFVFPGGAVDTEDARVELAGLPDEACQRRLTPQGSGPTAQAILTAAIRETWEETGLRLASKGAHPPLWDGFDQGGFTPSAEGLRYIFRAITPPGRPRRFDARFFLANATALTGDLDDFSKAQDELSHLHWVALSKARELDLPFITEVVLAEVETLVASDDAPSDVPFFDNSGPQSLFSRIR